MKLNRVLGSLLLLSMLSCSRHPSSGLALINEGASLAGNLPFAPLQWKIICSSISRRDGTMATVYGNDLAVRHARENLQPTYPQGSTLSLVTWSQEADSHWFGGRIPGSVKSVEFVSVSSDSLGRPSLSYLEFRGSPLMKVASAAGTADSRIAYILAQRASVTP